MSMILIIDNYDSFTYNLVHLIARGTDDLIVRRNDDLSVEDIAEMKPDGILISPGPGRPAEAGVTCEMIETLSDRIPILGVCLGHQAIGEVFGGTVTYAPTLMHGKTSEIQHDGLTVFRDIPQRFTATRYHSLVVSEKGLPECLQVSASTIDGVIMGLRHRDRPVEGIQFHPESLLTRVGPDLIANWMASLPIVAS